MPHNRRISNKNNFSNPDNRDKCAYKAWFEWKTEYLAHPNTKNPGYYFGHNTKPKDQQLQRVMAFVMNNLHKFKAAEIYDNSQFDKETGMRGVVIKYLDRGTGELVDGPKPVKEQV